MNASGVKIFSIGTGALTVEFGREISVELNRKAIALADHCNAFPFEGFIESVPAFASTSIFFDVLKVRRAFNDHSSAFDAVASIVSGILPSLKAVEERSGPLVEVPISFSKENALDLEDVAKFASLPRADVIEIFTSATYRVFMIGFLPGFAYMGEVDERISAPRKPSPRSKVPAGSVGIAGGQTGIYPFESPGGWQIIGRTHISLFDAAASEPCFFRSGDRVRFVISDK